MDAIRDGLNFHIKKLYKKIKVSVLKVKKEKKDFHARFSVKQKTYVYKILDRRPPPAIEKKRVWHVKKKLDYKSMKKAARILVGKHDFTSFRSTECQAKSALKTIDSIKILRVREEIQIWIKARSFLHNQVRIIAGTLVMVGKKKWKEKNIEQEIELSAELNLIKEKKANKSKSVKNRKINLTFGVFGVIPSYLVRIEHIL